MKFTLSWAREPARPDPGPDLRGLVWGGGGEAGRTVDRSSSDVAGARKKKKLVRVGGWGWVSMPLQTVIRVSCFVEGSSRRPEGGRGGGGGGETVACLV